MYKTILVAIDDSEFSKAAVIESANWVKKHGGKIILLNVAYFDEEEFSNAPEQHDRRAEHGKKICSKAQEMLRSEFKIEAEAIVREGDPPTVITTIAAEREADVIAIGTYGRKGLKRIIMGSVASSVISDSPCDVMVVKKACTECSGSYSSILMPFDGSVSSRKALIKACKLSKVDNADITVLYVIPRYEEMIGFFKTESIKKSLFKEAEKILTAAKEVASAQGVSIAMTIEEGNAVDKIVKTSEALYSDLIVTSTYGWRGVDKAIMGSTTERVLINASIPVLVVR